MSLLNLFKKPKLTNKDQKPSSQGRVLKEISELELLYTEKTTLQLLYKTIMSIDSQENRLKTINYLTKLLLDIPLTPIDHPCRTDEFVSHTNQKLQSSRCKSLWSHDRGFNWYDIDNDTRIHRIYRWIYKNIFKSSQSTPQFITNRMLPYVSFPYTKDIK